ncbi:hypothetical protein Salat_0656700 [Sesamum alatum]|uniref:Uncharacterized protein n=1 Tax=Sesamum alatum TaxID=300844 RepID=A0AAE1YRN9_9LAMI|nr:hypothetical protein Salat_0656700 [Sesamum alatum]
MVGAICWRSLSSSLRNAAIRGSLREGGSGCFIRGSIGGFTGSCLFWGKGICSPDRDFSPFMVSITLSAALAPFFATSSNRSLISSIVWCGCLDGFFEGLVVSPLRASLPLASSSYLLVLVRSSLVILPPAPRS